MLFKVSGRNLASTITQHTPGRSIHYLVSSRGLVRDGVNVHCFLVIRFLSSTIRNKLGLCNRAVHPWCAESVLCALGCFVST